MPLNNNNLSIIFTVKGGFGVLGMGVRPAGVVCRVLAIGEHHHGMPMCRQAAQHHLQGDDALVRGYGNGDLHACALRQRVMRISNVSA